MGWICTRCGNENSFDETHCQVCGRLQNTSRKADHLYTKLDLLLGGTCSLIGPLRLLHRFVRGGTLLFGLLLLLSLLLRSRSNILLFLFTYLAPAAGELVCILLLFSPRSSQLNTTLSLGKNALFWGKFSYLTSPLYLLGGVFSKVKTASLLEALGTCQRNHLLLMIGFGVLHFLLSRAYKNSPHKEEAESLSGSMIRTTHLSLGLLLLLHLLLSRG